MNIRETYPRAGAEPCTIAPELITPWATPAARDDASGPNSRFNSCDGGQQHAAHVIDYGCWAALKRLRDIGACGRKASRKLSDFEIDENLFSIENGDGEIY